jgi:hypothetical protein
MLMMMLMMMMMMMMIDRETFDLKLNLDEREPDRT